ncbi:MAG: HAMP domain-containing histidine kinase [Myxococcales bacterium]|nr:HAMP domain-containing histidine kinase [Myxococcales bacterium]
MSLSPTPTPIAAAEELTRLELEAVGFPMVVCDAGGRIMAATPEARTLMGEVGARCDGLPCAMPESLWQALSSTPIGQSTDYRPETDSERCIGFTRYRYGRDWQLLLMREITDVQVELRRRLQQQRLEAIGRLVAGIAHDLRAPLSSIVFGASVLAQRCDEMSREQIKEKLGQINAAAARQQQTIAGLLDFARLGPPVKVDLSLRHTLSRVAALLRPTLRDGGHQIIVQVDEDADAVHGNPLVIEQILVNLIINATEAAEGACRIQLHGECAAANTVHVHVRDDGPGIPEQLRARIFDPFFTTKREGTGLGLMTAREAAINLGGNLELSPGTSDGGAHFIVTMPAAVADRGERG